MYGLPRDIDLSFFIGKELIQVCLGQAQIILNFYDQKIELNITGAFTFNGEYYESQGDGKTGHLLHILLEKKSSMLHMEKVQVI